MSILAILMAAIVATASPAGDVITLKNADVMVVDLVAPGAVKL